MADSGRNQKIISFIFWRIREQENLLLKFTDLYGTNLYYKLPYCKLEISSSELSLKPLNAAPAPSSFLGKLIASVAGGLRL